MALVIFHLFLLGLLWEFKSVMASGDPAAGTPATLPFCPKDPWNRIYGGQKASIGEIPWQLAILFKSNFNCGATLIDPYWALTAAHCFYYKDGTAKSLEASNWKIAAGVLDLTKNLTHDEQTLSVEKIFIHEKYNWTTQENDITLMKLGSPVRETRSSKIVSLATSGELSSKRAKASGWGETGKLLISDHLLQACVDIFANEVCEREAGNFVYNGTTMLCAGEFFKGTCRGDSGGPLVICIGNGNDECTPELVGIVSYGSTSCPDIDLSAVYTRVSFYLPWIKCIQHSFGGQCTAV